MSDHLLQQYLESTPADNPMPVDVENGTYRFTIAKAVPQVVGKEDPKVKTSIYLRPIEVIEGNFDSAAIANGLAQDVRVEYWNSPNSYKYPSTIINQNAFFAFVLDMKMDEVENFNKMAILEMILGHEVIATVEHRPADNRVPDGPTSPQVVKFARA